MSAAKERDLVRELNKRGKTARLYGLYSTANAFEAAAAEIVNLRLQRTTARRDGDRLATRVAAQRSTINRLRQERDAYKAETERRAQNATNAPAREKRASAKAALLCADNARLSEQVKSLRQFVARLAHRLMNCRQGLKR